MADVPTTVTQAPKSWKTNTAAGALVVIGVAGLLIHYLGAPGAQGGLSVSDALTVIVSGLGVFGVGSKLQKIVDALKGN